MWYKESDDLADVAIGISAGVIIFVFYFQWGKKKILLLAVMQFQLYFDRLWSPRMNPGIKGSITKKYGEHFLPHLSIQS